MCHMSCEITQPSFKRQDAVPTSNSQTCQSSSTRRSKPNSSKQLGNVKKVSSLLTACRHSPASHMHTSHSQPSDVLQFECLHNISSALIVGYTQSFAAVCQWKYREGHQGQGQQVLPSNACMSCVSCCTRASASCASIPSLARACTSALPSATPVYHTEQACLHTRAHVKHCRWSFTPLI